MTVLVAALALAACGEGTPTVGGGSGAGSVLDEDGWRVVADGPGGPPDGHEAATAAVDHDDLAEQWEAYRAEGAPEDLEDGEVAILLGFGESGSCPEEVREIRVDDEAGEVVVDRQIEGDPGQGCTDDYNPRTIVLAVDAAALPDGPFLLASVGTQLTFWHGVAPGGAQQPPADHPHLGLGYGQQVPVATLDAEPREVTVGEEVRLVVTAAEADVEPAVGDGTSHDPHDELAREDREAAGELDEERPMVPGTLEVWDSHRWVATQGEAERHEGHPAIERIGFGELDPGQSADAGVVDTGELEPGVYRVTLQVLGLGQRGPGDVSAQFTVVAD